MRFLYDILFCFGFVFFLPSLVWKLVHRGGEKRNYAERFAYFNRVKKRRLQEKFRGGIWVHAVSVGETVVALSLIKCWQERDPDLRVVLSTTTTTGQALARRAVGERLEIIFCPLDFGPFVRRVVRLLRPRLLLIFETEIWPNLICEVRRSGGRAALVNARISDRSARGYQRWRSFFAPVLRQFDLICVQSELDRGRFSAVCSALPLHVCGTMKFDQELDADGDAIDLSPFFGVNDDYQVLLAASTHSGEERLILESFCELRRERFDLRLIIVPRHAERGGEIESMLKEMGLRFIRRSRGGDLALSEGCEVLLADTTGEMPGFMAAADIVFMGKSLAGHCEGHNLIEPALLAKPIVSGSELSNFRFVMEVLKSANALAVVASDGELTGVLRNLLNAPESSAAMGARAREAVLAQRGAIERTLALLAPLLEE